MCARRAGSPSTTSLRGLGEDLAGGVGVVVVGQRAAAPCRPSRALLPAEGAGSSRAGRPGGERGRRPGPTRPVCPRRCAAAAARGRGRWLAAPRGRRAAGSGRRSRSGTTGLSRSISGRRSASVSSRLTQTTEPDATARLAGLGARARQRGAEHLLASAARHGETSRQRARVAGLDVAARARARRASAAPPHGCGSRAPA